MARESPTQATRDVEATVKGVATRGEQVNVTLNMLKEMPGGMSRATAAPPLGQGIWSWIGPTSVWSQDHWMSSATVRHGMMLKRPR